MRNALLACLALALLSACGQKAEQKKAVPPPSLITVTQATKGDFEVVLETLGSLEVLADPKVGAEVAGRVTQVLARSGKAVKAGDLLAVIDAGDVALQNRADEAEARRVEALAKQQEKPVATDADGQWLSVEECRRGRCRPARRALRPFDAARARRQQPPLGQQDRVISPMTASSRCRSSLPRLRQSRRPAVQSVAPNKLRAHLPFAESFGPRLKPGQEVRLLSPLAPGKVFASRIKDIRPGIVEGSRTLDVLVDIDNDGSLRGGGTVNATVIVSARAEALTVPEQSVGLRPAGKVVYVIADVDGQKKAQQKPVKVGAKRGGRIEILEGLAGGSHRPDGAGFTNGAAVAIKEAAAGRRPHPNPSPATGEGSRVMTRLLLR